MRNHCSVNPALPEPTGLPIRLCEGGQLVSLMRTFEERIALYLAKRNDVSFWDDKDDEDGE